MKFYRKQILRTSVIFFLCLFVLPQSVDALTLSPTRFELFGNPGQTLSAQIKLINESSKTENLFVTYSNFEAQGETGSPTFVDPKEGIGTWIFTEKNSYIVGPGKQEEVNFQIKIPQNAEPGGHFGVVFFGNNPAGGSQVSIGSQTGVLILLSVSGDVKEDAGLLSFNTANKKFWYKTLPISFEYRFKNDGGDRVKPLGRVSIRNTLFIPTERLNANPVEGNVLPRSTRKFTTTWIEQERPIDHIPSTNVFARFWDNAIYQWKNFALGLYSANLKIEYGSTPDKARSTTFFFVFPWELVVVLIFTLTILFFGGRSLLRKYNRYIIAQAQKQKLSSDQDV